MTGIPKKQEAPGTAGGQPFAANEKRTLTLRAERIDPERLIDGKPPKVEAVHERTEKFSTHVGRFFQLTIRNPQSSIRIQLNHGKPADDAERLIVIAEDFLSPEQEEAPGIAGGLNAEKLSDTGGISPSSAGGL